SDDLRHAMEDACRALADCPAETRDLSWFFKEWLNRGGILKLNGTWRYDAAAKQVVVSLDQTQTTGLYRMPIEIAVTVAPASAARPRAATPAGTGAAGGAGAAGRQGGAGRGGNAGPATTITRVWINVDQAHTTVTIPVTAEPTTVELDSRTWVT